MTTYNCNIGSINEPGLIRGLYRRGMTEPLCLSELVANSIDAGANNIDIPISTDYTKIIDDGKGMTKDGSDNMWSLWRENHAHEHR